MRKLGTIAARLARQRHQWERFAASALERAHSAEALPSHLTEVTEFGSNPGSLRMIAHVPEGLPQGAPLVVALHGCTQDAAGYDRGTGWSALADAHGFALLLPQQRPENNARACFNWFESGDIARGQGEALSIRQMIEHLAVAHGIDRARVYVTGLSAGGAMAGVMLATYPEVFAGGAILAGLPYGSARSVREALDCMFQGCERSSDAWGDEVRRASPHRGPWPKIAVWHGSADATVLPSNADEIVKQWRDVHGLDARPAQEERVGPALRRAWAGPDGAALVESYMIPGMAHGAPLAAGPDETPGPFLLDVGLSSTRRMAEAWGLTTGARAAEPAGRSLVAIDAAAAQGSEGPDDARSTARSRDADGDRSRFRPAGIDPGAVIVRALTKAGLMGRR